MKLTRLGAFSILVLGLSTLAGGFFGNRVLAGGNKLSDHLRLYTSILSAVEENYADPVKSDKLVSSSIREMLRTLDPHSNFLETKEYTTLQERQKGSYYGLGITVQSIDGNITVVSPFEGTPAARLGIRAGDVISKIEARGRARHGHRRCGQAPARPQGHAGAHHDRAPGLRHPSRVHRPARRDPAALRALLLHGLEEDGVHPADRLQRDDGLPPRRSRGLREGAGEGAARAHAAGRHFHDPGHPRQPGRAARPGLRGLEPVPEEGTDGRLHPRPDASATKRAT